MEEKILKMLEEINCNLVAIKMNQNIIMDKLNKKNVASCTNVFDLTKSTTLTQSCSIGKAPITYTTTPAVH